MVRLFLKEKASVNERMKSTRDTALHMVCKNCHQEIAKELITHGADLRAANVSGGKNINLSSKLSSHPLMIPNKKKKHFLFTWLYFQDCLSIVSYMLELDEQDKQRALPLATYLKRDGTSALHLIALKTKTEGVIIKHGANVLGQDNFGRTALHIAASNGNANLVKFLLTNSEKVRQNVDILDEDGHSPLHTVCSGIKA